MYGSVLGASVTAGSVAVLPHTGGSTLSVALTLACLTSGVAITVISVARIMANKYFA